MSAVRGRHGEGTDPSLREPANAHRTADGGCEGNVGSPRPIDDSEEKQPRAADPFRLLLQQVRELAEYLSYYLSAKTDGVALCVRSLVFRGILAALGFVALSGLIVGASWRILGGTAEGLALILGNRMWAGNIAAGLLAMAAVGAGVGWLTAKRKRARLAKATERYAVRQARQEADLGHNVSERASSVPTQRK